MISVKALPNEQLTLHLIHVHMLLCFGDYRQRWGNLILNELMIFV
jgi:hypothetical protein